MTLLVISKTRAMRLNLMKLVLLMAHRMDTRGRRHLQEGNCGRSTPPASRFCRGREVGVDGNGPGRSDILASSHPPSAPLANNFDLGRRAQRGAEGGNEGGVCLCGLVREEAICTRGLLVCVGLSTVVAAPLADRYLCWGCGPAEIEVCVRR